MPPELNFRRRGVHGAYATSKDFRVVITRRSGKACGYPQCTWMWHMKFERGGCCASAFLENLGAAQWNAARIVAGMRGTHDWHGNAKRAA